jgi:hypothetical protein
MSNRTIQPRAANFSFRRRGCLGKGRALALLPFVANQTKPFHSARFTWLLFPVQAIYTSLNR